MWIRNLGCRLTWTNSSRMLNVRCFVFLWSVPPVLCLFQYALIIFVTTMFARCICTWHTGVSQGRNRQVPAAAREQEDQGSRLRLQNTCRYFLKLATNMKISGAAEAALKLYSVRFGFSHLLDPQIQNKPNWFIFSLHLNNTRVPRNLIFNMYQEIWFLMKSLNSKWLNPKDHALSNGWNIMISELALVLESYSISWILVSDQLEYYTCK